MPEPPESESVSLEDLVYSNMVQIKAVTLLCIEKGIFTAEELEAVHAEQHKKAGQPHLNIILGFTPPAHKP